MNLQAPSSTTRARRAHYNLFGAHSNFLTRRRFEQGGPSKLALAVAALLALYLSTAPGNRAEADDAFMFASLVEDEDASQLLNSTHVRHLLYLPLIRAVLAGISWLPVEVRAYPVMNAISVVAAVGGVFVFRALLLRRFGCSRFVASASAIGLAVSYGFWRYATEGDAYSVALVLVLLACYVGLQDRPSLVTTALAGVLAALAVTTHILNLSAVLVVLPLAMLFARQWRQLLVYGTVAFSATIVITFCAFKISSVDGRYIDYVVFSGGEDTYQADYSATSVVQSGVGLGQTVLSGNFVFAYEPVAERMKDAFPAKLLQDDIYFGERAPLAARVLPPIVLVVLIVVLGYVATRLYGIRGSLETARPSYNGRLLAVCAWGLTYWLIKVGREPADPESWIQMLPVLWIVAGTFVFHPLSAKKDGNARWAVVAIIALIATHNFFGGLLPVLPKATDYHVQKARWLIVKATPEDEIITADGAVFARYLDYHTLARVYDTRSVASRTIRERLLSAHADGGGRIFATADVLDPPSSWKAYDRQRYQEHIRLLRKVADSFVLVEDNEFGGIYEYMRG